MKILIDMNLSPGWRLAFEQEGIEALHWSEVGATTALIVVEPGDFRVRILPI